LTTNELTNFRTNELARSGQAGWWIDIGEEPLVAALKEAMTMSDENRRQMGSNGRRLVEVKYTWPVIAAEMRKAYHGLLTGKVQGFG
jgi:glycosyltransferase involved in cell wall biosynthesis